MYPRMASWLSHTVIVQKVRSRSGSNAPCRNPGARFTCAFDRNACHANSGRNRTDRTRNRVRLTKTIPSNATGPKRRGSSSHGNFQACILSCMPQAPSPATLAAEARTAFDQSLRLIHDHPEQHGLIHAAVHRWYALFHQATGVDAFDYNGSPDIALPSGLALGASAAAFCLLEGQRTAVFLRGIEHAIRDLQQQFPDERIRILYAGCGPYASLLTPLIVRFSAQEVGWHLLDVNPHSLQSVQRLYRALDLEPWLLPSQLADAATFVMPTAEPFHLVISETMQRALQNETQLAIMLNLLPQLQPRALFLPQSISIQAAVQRWQPYSTEVVPSPTFQTFGTVYEIGQHSMQPPQETHLTVPTLSTPGGLSLTTTVTVYKNEALSGNDTSITLPKDLHQQLRGNEQLLFRYQWEPHPGFVCEVAETSRILSSSQTD